MFTVWYDSEVNGPVDLEVHASLESANAFIERYLRFDRSAERSRFSVKPAE